MSDEKRILLCLATRKGREVLDAAIAAAPAERFLVCTFEEKNVAESFHDDIVQTAEKAGIAVVQWSAFKHDPVAFIESRDLGAVLCIGWRYLVADEAVEALDGQVIIAHDSLLPKLRGFAPLPTALIAGETETGVTFLRAGTDTDNGPILWQGRCTIEPSDTIATLIEKTLPLYREGAERFFRGELTTAVPQDESRATYSVWRGAEDYRVDWTQDAETIHRTVRALGPPYLGAQTKLGEQTVVVEAAAPVSDLKLAIRQPGKIWKLDENGRPTVICGRGLLKILAATVDGQSVLPLRSLRSRFR